VFAAGNPAAGDDTFEIFAAGFFENAGSALTTALNQRTTVEVVGVETRAVDALTEGRPLPWVLVEAPYTRGLSGTHWLALTMADAQRLAEALLGGHDEPGELRDGHLEAIRDAVNQMLAAAGPALMPLIGRSVAYGPAKVRVVETELPGELGGATERLAVARARARAEGGLEVELACLTGEALRGDIASAGAAVTSAPAPAATDEQNAARLELILDVTLPVTVELGRARMQIQEVLKLAPGSVIELDKSAGDPVELYINDRPIAKGEVVIIDENFGIRLTSIVTATERIKTLR
jgi:flagellar motor switch protein FliN/FliY